MKYFDLLPNWWIHCSRKFFLTMQYHDHLCVHTPEDLSTSIFSSRPAKLRFLETGYTKKAKFPFSQVQNQLHPVASGRFEIDENQYGAPMFPLALELSTRLQITREATALTEQKYRGYIDTPGPLPGTSPAPPMVQLP